MIFNKTAKAVSEKEKELEEREGLIEEKGRELSEKQAALATVTMKIADIESLVEEVADTAYEKACEVVADTVRAETQKEDIRVVEDYKKRLASPERKAPQEKRDFAVKCLCTVQEQESDVRTFIREIRQYATVRELDEGILNRLISRILVGEVKKVGGEKFQEIKIIYNFVGEIPAVTE